MGLADSFDFEMGLFTLRMPSAVTYVKINPTSEEQTVWRAAVFQGASGSAIRQELATLVLALPLV